MQVVPTPSWNRTLFIPGHGSVRPPVAGQPAEVTTQQAHWLIQNGFASDGAVASRPSAAASSPTKAKRAQATKSEADAPKPSSPKDAVQSPPAEMEDWKIQCINFFKSAKSADSIADAINGIGNRTAAAIIRLRDGEDAFNWDAIATILTSSQEKACQQKFTPNSEELS